ncbi:hypothetical protein AB4Z48_21000 [Cupriavidus sp. 2TAF22]|uniref:hypothetical protein n=1 Tax=unclassified Cupriavidus TaxID=2640874 RepID=UPI003F91120E
MKRELLSYFAVLGGIAAATLFLCARPDAAPAPRAAAQPAALRHAVMARAEATPPAAELAVQAGDLGSRADRHASDALRLAQQPAREEDLEWDYVQLRL